MILHKTYKFRLFPNKTQQKLMDNTLELCRIVYNKSLAEKKNKYENEKKNLSKYDLHNLLPKWKQENPELNNVYSQILQETQERVDLAYKNFFRRVKEGNQKVGYPRFKGKGYNSFSYPQSGYKIEGSYLTLSKIGKLYLNLHRPLKGKVKRLNINVKNDKWFACFTIEYEQEIVNKETFPAVGVDLGLKTFAVLSDGNKVDNPKFYKNEENKLAKAQNKLSKEKKQTLGYSKRRKIVQKIHERIANKRNDFIHKESNKLVNKYNFIVFEDLDINNMMENNYKNINKSINDVAWNMLVKTTQYKAENAGKTVVLVNPKDTSKICSKCGIKVEKTLEDRIHICPECGLKMDRDLNASINILRLGLQSVGIESIEAHDFQSWE